MELVRKHTERLTRETLRTLIDVEATPCVSIYLPTHKAGSDIEQDPIRLKNLLSDAEQQLADRGMRTPDIQDLLAPMKDLISDREFWQHQSRGLALFGNPEHMKYYRLPTEFNEIVSVDDRFHIKPLLPLLSGNGRFYLLSLSQNSVCFYEGTRFRVGEIKLGDDTPTSLSEAMRFDEFESQLQFHTRSSPHSNTGAQFYGMSDAGDEAVIKENIKRFLRMVDNGIQKQMAHDKIPLILAGVEFMRGLFREVSQYDYILDEGVGGNPEHLSPEELHRQAWPLVEPHFQRTIEQAIDNYQQLSGNGDKRASSTLDNIVSGAYFQRVDTLFVQTGTQKWGTFDDEHNEVTCHEEKQSGDSDLVDFAAAHTILNGGVVYALEPDEMPGDCEVCAIFRY